MRTHNLLRHLARRHDVRLFAQPRLGYRRPADSPPYREYVHGSRVARALCSASEWAWVSAPIPSGAGLRLARPAPLDDLLEWAEVVLVEFPWQFEYCHRRRPSAPLVLSAINVEAAKFASWADAAGAGRLRRRGWLRRIERAEAYAVAHAELITVVSESDRVELAARYGVDRDRVVVVPNGADTQAYRPVDPGRRAAAKRELGLPDRPTVLFAAADMPANRAGLGWVKRVAAMSERFTFLVVGEVAEAGVRGNVVATGLVPEFRAWLEAADLAICPIEHGGGTKIKLLEALAAGLPTVAFPHAVHGLEVADGRELVVASPSERELLAALARVADDTVLAERIATGGRRFVVAGHDWADAARRLEAALLGLLGRRPPLERPVHAARA